MSLFDINDPETDDDVEVRPTGFDLEVLYRSEDHHCLDQERVNNQRMDVDDGDVEAKVPILLIPRCPKYGKKLKNRPLHEIGSTTERSLHKPSVHPVVFVLREQYHSSYFRNIWMTKFHLSTRFYST
jgi:hypothetical protein